MFTQLCVGLSERCVLGLVVVHAVPHGGIVAQHPDGDKPCIKQTHAPFPDPAKSAIADIWCRPKMRNCAPGNDDETWRW
jgi:hypothetical protein